MDHEEPCCSSSLRIDDFESYDDYIAKCYARMKDLKACRTVAKRRGDSVSVKRIQKRIELLQKEKRDALELFTSREDPNYETSEDFQQSDEEKEEESKDEERHEEKEDKVKKESREKKECPHLTCKAMVVHLPRHLRTVHKWSQERARSAVQRFGIRKLPVKDESHGKDYHIKKLCPVPSCASITKRMSDHLLRVHKMDKGSTKYKDYLKSAKPFVGNVERYLKKRKEDAISRKELIEKMNKEEEEEEEEEEEIELEDKVVEVEEGENKIVEDVIQEVDDGEVEEEMEVEVDDGELEGEMEVEEGMEVEDAEVNDGEEIEVPMKNGASESVEAVLTCFKNWLVSPDGGKNDLKTATQHMKQLRRVLQIIHGEQELGPLFDYKVIRDSFITEHAEQVYNPKTIKSYIMSIRHFYSFILNDEPESVVFDKGTVLMLRERLERWTKSYKSDCRKQEWKKKKKDQKRLVTASAVHDFEKSKAARDAIVMLGHLSGAHSIEVTQANFTLVRDFLLAEIAIDNANRAGVVANMTVNEFQSAISMEDGDHYIVEVMNHKTLESKGPANVVLSKKLHSWLLLYLNEVRPQVCRTAKNPTQFFLSWNGNKLESSQINKALKSVWKKANIEAPICSTDFRKGAVTEIYTNHKSCSGNLADLLDHNESTGNKYYRLSDKNNSSLKASKILAQVMRAPTNACAKKKCLQADTSSPEIGPDDSGKSQASKQSWSSEAEEAIKSIFKDEITEKAITIDTVRQKIVDVPILADQNPKRILDKVRAQWRFSKQEETDVQPPAEHETEEQRVNRLFDDDAASNNTNVIYPTEYSGSMKGIFTENSVKVLLRICDDMVTTSFPIGAKVIEERLKEDEEGKKMLQFMNVRQIINRVKYERKMYRVRKQEKSQKRL